MTKETGSLKASLQIILFCLAQEDRWLTGGQRPGGPWGRGRRPWTKGAVATFLRL